MSEGSSAFERDHAGSQAHEAHDSTLRVRSPRVSDRYKCCWLLMALLFVAGVMNLFWMAAITLFILAEKIVPTGDLIGRIAGGMLIAGGIVFIMDEVDDLIAEGDKVVVRWRLLGTHKGDFRGIAPTGRAIALKGIAIYRVKDGKLMERWVVSDLHGLLEEIRGSSR